MLQSINIRFDAIKVILRNQNLIRHRKSLFNFIRPRLFIFDLEHHKISITASRNQILIIMRNTNFLNTRIIMRLKLLHMLRIRKLITFDRPRIIILIISATEEDPPSRGEGNLRTIILD